MSTLSFFLVCQAKRARHANAYARDWRRQTGEAAVSRVSPPSCARALLLRNLKKRRDCEQSNGYCVNNFLLPHCFCKAPYSKRKTTKAVSAKPSPETPKITESSTDSSVTTKPSLKTTTASAITVTPSKEYIPGSKEANKDNEALSDKDDERSMTMIAVISGVAAVGCLVLGFLCLWKKTRYGVKSTLKLWTPSYDGNLTRIKAKFSVKSTDVWPKQTLLLQTNTLSDVVLLAAQKL